MLKIFTAFILSLFILIFSNSYSKTTLKPFVSVGSSGIGLGGHVKTYTFFCRYYYLYQDDPTYYVYYHFPSISVTHSIIQENRFTCYTGLNYSVRCYKQKYFFSGTWNFNNYNVAVPIGLTITPFDRLNRLSFLLESGIQFEHLRSYKLSYDWQLGLANFVFDIRFRIH